MRVVHWSSYNRSGMHKAASSLFIAERALGLDSKLVNVQESPEWDEFADADIHVAHTFFPEAMRKRLTKPLKLVWVGHGIPEHVFDSAINMHRYQGYGHGDPWMLLQHFLREADARVTFWDRHAWFYRSMLPRSVPVHVVPMGIEHDFWAGGKSAGKFAGAPSALTLENIWREKWPLELFQCWADVYRAVPGACLHSPNVPADQHRYWAPLINANGASYGMHWSDHNFPHGELRNVFKSIDFYVGLVRYGDFNRTSHEASVAGAKVISYRGNPYADFWVSEGDQRVMRDELIGILSGETPARDRLPVPHIAETAAAMKAIYEGIV